MDAALTPFAGPVFEAFGWPAAGVRMERWGSGHINESYRVGFDGADGRRRALLQRINHEVFPDPGAVTDSIRRVTEHLRAKADGHSVLELLESRDGRVCVPTEDGSWWRAFHFVEGARSYDVVASPTMARRAAYAFGHFQRALADLPEPRLPETIEGFHDTPKRCRAFRRAVEVDAAGRVRDAGPEIECALRHESDAGALQEAHEAGELPERVTHNDTKINNVLFDESTGEAVCVIDLDTVMPGLGPYDFGDMVRTTSCRAAEDERDLGRMEADPELVVALAEGYLGAMGELAGPRERQLLVRSGELITFEIGLRFLTDFLEGDVYFRTSRPHQNLDRCRAQFALLASLERQRSALEKRVAAIA